MQYEISELLQQTGWLAEQYTSKDTSSIPYETAKMLMEAVLYCLDEYERLDESGDGTNHGRLAACGKSEMLGKPDIKTAYGQGYQAVLMKARRAKESYEAIIHDFEDYGCRNYRDTITKGIPGFFLRYNARFCPQDHILTLDYPVLGGNSFTSGGKPLCGVHLIDHYLKVIKEEKKFLNLFNSEAVRNLMEAVYPEYEELYLNNLCEPVLLNAVGCLIAKKPVISLEVGLSGLNVIEGYFKGFSTLEIQQKLIPCIRTLTADSWWFDMAAGVFAPQIENAVRFGCLDRLFQAGRLFETMPDSRETVEFSSKLIFNLKN